MVGGGELAGARQRLADGGGEAIGVERMGLAEHIARLVEAKFVAEPVEDGGGGRADLLLDGDQPFHVCVCSPLSVVKQGCNRQLLHLVAHWR